MEVLGPLLDRIPSSISLLVAGKTGVGKSALTNSLIGKKVAEEGAGVESCTRKVKDYKDTILCAGRKAIYITIWDSPGYEEEDTKNGGESGDHNTYFKELKKAKDVDLLVFCTSFRERRWRIVDTNAMKAIHKAFGPSIWNQAMIALTEANDIRDSDGPLTTEAYFDKFSEWTEKIDKELQNLGVQTKVFAVPTGDFKNMRLHNTDNWFSEFWTTACCSLRADKRVAFALLGKQRLVFCKPDEESNARSAEGDRRSAGGEERSAGGEGRSGRCTESGNNSWDCPIKLSDTQTTEVKNSLWEGIKAVGGMIMSGLKPAFKALVSFLGF